MVQKARKLHLRDIKMIKDDQRGIRNPYKCMNVMKQDAMDDKIKERCKTHTHTLNKSHQFYISKTSQDSLVSIH